jgi:hypothetical protein
MATINDADIVRKMRELTEPFTLTGGVLIAGNVFRTGTMRILTGHIQSEVTAQNPKNADEEAAMLIAKRITLDGLDPKALTHTAILELPSFDRGELDMAAGRLYEKYSTFRDKQPATAAANGGKTG